MHNALPIKLSIIVTTYHWPQALGAVLNALVNQKTAHIFEIIVADNGSKEETAKLIRDIKQVTDIPILHIWQPDEGFRVAAIRNKAILAAEGNYIVFLDGNCIPRENFVENHFRLAQPHTFVVGNRVWLNQLFSELALSQGLPLHQWSLWRWCLARLSGHCNKVLPFLSLPWEWVSIKTAARWKGAKGCNIAMWKKDLLNINGWEEKFVGCGYEDSDLVIRLLRSGVKRKSGRFRIPVIRLWRLEKDRAKKRENWTLLRARQQEMRLCAEQGLKQYDL